MQQLLDVLFCFFLCQLVLLELPHTHLTPHLQRLLNHFIIGVRLLPRSFLSAQPKIIHHRLEHGPSSRSATLASKDVSPFSSLSKSFKVILSLHCARQPTTGATCAVSPSAGEAPSERMPHSLSSSSSAKRSQASGPSQANKAEPSKHLRSTSRRQAAGPTAQ